MFRVIPIEVHRGSTNCAKLPNSSKPAGTTEYAADRREASSIVSQVSMTTILLILTPHLIRAESSRSNLSARGKTPEDQLRQ